MTRLTRLAGYRNNIPIYIRNTGQLRGRPSAQTVSDLIDRLGPYEDAEEHKRLLHLPDGFKELCGKIGDSVYLVENGDLSECLLFGISFDMNAVPCMNLSDNEGELVTTYGKGGVHSDVVFVKRSIDKPIEEYGRSVFLTKEEAWAAREAECVGAAASVK